MANIAAIKFIDGGSWYCHEVAKMLAIMSTCTGRVSLEHMSLEHDLRA